MRNCRSIIALACLIGVATIATANANVWMPPQGISQSCKVRTVYADYWAVNALCTGRHRKSANGRVEACVWKNRKGWQMILPRASADVPKSAVEELRGHECGHVNGWGANHPGAN